MAANTCIATRRDGNACTTNATSGLFCGTHAHMAAMHSIRERHLASQDLRPSRFIVAIADNYLSGNTLRQPEGEITLQAQDQNIRWETSLLEHLKNHLEPLLPALLVIADSRWDVVSDIKHLDLIPKAYRPQRCGVVIADQLNRAGALARALRPSHTHVRLMDGHGAFLTMFLRAVLSLYGRRRLNGLTIQLVDNNANADDYHKSVLSHPRIQCLKEDAMFRDTDGKLVLPPDTTLQYLNFAGISKSFTDVVKYFKMCAAHGRSLFISFSLARCGSQKPYYACLVKALEDVRRKGATLEARESASLMSLQKVDLAKRREDFRTVALVPAAATICLKRAGKGWYRVYSSHGAELGRVRLHKDEVSAYMVTWDIQSIS